MYKQNGSREKCFEALDLRVPWPDWIAELERTGLRQPEVRSGRAARRHRGATTASARCCSPRWSRSAAAGAAANNFGAIFCDREAARLRRVGGAAADLLALNLPPDAARMLASPEISEQAYILWDLIHDRTHSHGELPFDPFMIRQRAPYWMYSLEELRCDLTAFGEALALERRGPERSRSRATSATRSCSTACSGSRSPGSRVRNYDGLGGQLLFAYLHRHGYLHWADNRLTIEWDRVGEASRRCASEIEALYRAGIDRTKLRHWVAAHDLIAESVPAGAGSKWAAGVAISRSSPIPRPYVDLVLDDEFPLSIFYSSLRAKLAAVSDVRARGFASDNAATVHPEVIAAIVARQRRARVRLRARSASREALGRALHGALRRAARRLPRVERHRRQRPVRCARAAGRGRR